MKFKPSHYLDRIFPGRVVNRAVTIAQRYGVANDASYGGSNNEEGCDRLYSRTESAVKVVKHDGIVITLTENFNNSDWGTWSGGFEQRRSMHLYIQCKGKPAVRAYKCMGGETGEWIDNRRANVKSIPETPWEIEQKALLGELSAGLDEIEKLHENQVAHS